MLSPSSSNSDRSISEPSMINSKSFSENSIEGYRESRLISPIDGKTSSKDSKSYPNGFSTSDT